MEQQRIPSGEGTERCKLSHQHSEANGSLSIIKLFTTVLMRVAHAFGG